MLIGLASAQLAGQDFLTGLDRVRADVAGQQLVPVPGLPTSTACGLAMRVQPAQWRAVEVGVAAVNRRMLGMVPAGRRAVLAAAATIDIVATDVECTAAANAGWPTTMPGSAAATRTWPSGRRPQTVLAADLLSGDQDPRSWVVDLLTRSLDGLPPTVRAGQVTLRADAGYFAGTFQFRPGPGVRPQAVRPRCRA